MRAIGNASLTLPLNARAGGVVEMTMGGVGLAAVQIAHRAGARVIAAAGSEDKLALCRTAGADEAREGIAAFLDKRQPSWLD